MSVTLIGINPLQRKLTKLANKVKNKTVLLKRIGVVLMQEVDKNFKDQGHEGKPWKDLAPSTILARRKGKRRSRGVQILRDTGQLKNSVTGLVKKPAVHVGTGKDYGKKHQEGIGVPKRQFLPSEKRALNLAIKTAEDYLK